VTVLVGIDVGTTGVKVVAVDESGRLLREAGQRYPLDTAGGGAEQRAEDWWDAVCAAAPGVVAGEPVSAVAVTGQAPTLVGVDAGGRPTGPALTWADRRAVADVEQVAAAVPDDRVRLDPFFGTAKLRWWARTRPEEATRATSVLTANGFVGYRLCGRAVLDESTAVMFQGWDDTAGALDPRLASAGVPIDLLPPVVPCTQVIGRVTTDLAGIPAGTPVLAGAIDSVGAALEAGALRPGDPFAEMTGFSTVGILAVPRGTLLNGYIPSRHAIPGTDLLLTAQVTTGSLVDWVVGLTGGDRGILDPAEILRRTRPGHLVMQPSFAGERTPTWDPWARGALVGLDLGTDPIDLILAVFEATAGALGADLAAVQAAGFPVTAVRCCGGGARNDAWVQIKADVFGREVEVPVAGHGAAVGAAYLAGLGTGRFSEADLRRFAGPVRGRWTPDPTLHEAYRRRGLAYADLRERLATWAGEYSADRGRHAHA
jgi:xylulokinase